MVECQDCGDGCQRRRRCPHCGLLVCGWCFNHVHGPQLEMREAVEKAAPVKAAEPYKPSSVGYEYH